MKKIVAIVLSFTGIGYAGVVEISTKNELDNLLNKNEKVVVEFYSPTCPHCISFNNKHIFESLSTELPTVAFVKINFNAGKSLFNQYNIHAFPSFIIFKNGQPGKTHQGSMTKAEFKKLI